MSQQDEKKISSMGRMARVMYAVLQTGGEWFTLSAMSRKTGLAPSTCHRYVTALVDEDMLEHGDGISNYRLTRRVRNLLIAQGWKLIHEPPKEQEAKLERGRGK
jgi:hypothetical protein